MLPIELICRRKALGMSQEELSQAIGTKQATISRWEKGQRLIPEGLHDTLAGLEDTVERIYDEICIAVSTENETQSSPVHKTRVTAYPNNETFWAARPEMTGYSHTLHNIAAAHALVSYRELGIPIALIPTPVNHLHQSHVDTIADQTRHKESGRK